MEIGFLFDNDGVLIDSQKQHWQAWQQLMKERGQFFMNEKQFLETFGKRNDLILRGFLPKLTEEERCEIADQKEKCFRKVARGNITLLDGMEEFLKTLKKEEVPRIIASSTPVANLEMFLESTVLGKYFNAFVSADEVAHGKPAPDVFLEAALRLELPPNRCIVIEDAPVGIEAGKAAGCMVVALATTHPKEQLAKADIIYSSPKELRLEEIKKEFVICGYTKPRKSRKHFGSLIVGVYEKKDLIFAGHVGGGFSENKLKEIKDLLSPLETTKCPFKNPPKTNEHVTWVKPKMIAEVKFKEWTHEGTLRMPIFIGLRKDKKAQEIKREERAHAEKL